MSGQEAMLLVAGSRRIVVVGSGVCAAGVGPHTCPCSSDIEAARAELHTGSVLLALVDEDRVTFLRSW